MDEKKLYDLARQEDTEEDLLAGVRRFIEKNHLNKGFAKKPLDFFYFWYTIMHKDDITLQKFREAFPTGPFVYFSKEKLEVSEEEFRRIVIEYERKKDQDRSKKLRNKKKSLQVSVSKSKNEYTD